MANKAFTAAMDIENFIEQLRNSGESISQQEQAQLIKEARIRHFNKREVVFSEARIANHVAVVVTGVLASAFTFDDESSVSRFFCEGDVCANVESVFSENVASDSLFAITPATVILMPYKLYQELYLHSDQFGLYLRKQLLANTLTTKNVVSIKSQPSAKAKYEMLINRLPWVIERVPQKYVASFLGLTPQGYSRFLRSLSQ